MYVRVACPYYAAASCSCWSLSSVPPPYRIFLLCFRRVGVFICRVTFEYPKSAKNIAFEYTQEVLRLSAKSLFFPSKFFCVYK